MALALTRAVQFFSPTAPPDVFVLMCRTLVDGDLIVGSAMYTALPLGQNAQLNRVYCLAAMVCLDLRFVQVCSDTGWGVQNVSRKLAVASLTA